MMMCYMIIASKNSMETHLPDALDGWMDRNDDDGLHGLPNNVQRVLLIPSGVNLYVYLCAHQHEVYIYCYWYCSHSSH